VHLLLNVFLDDYPAYWSAEELALELREPWIDVEDALAALERGALIHPSFGFVFASRAAVTMQRLEDDRHG
jgi:hypothetical protein